ncbi:hypothetical protein I3760_03G119800 [Carya illinoinensis]|nr:hypothetical protein I3760_03G119800 [Carya illinoinensis]
MYFGRDLGLLHGYYRFDNAARAVMGCNDPILLIHFVLTAWGVWKYRNLKLFQQTNLDACVVVGNCFDYVENYQLICKHVKVHPNISSLRWIPPPCGSFKLNANGAIFSSLNISGWELSCGMIRVVWLWHCLGRS